MHICICIHTWINLIFICTHAHRDTHTLDKNGSLYDPAGTESCDMQIGLVSYLDKDEYIYIGLRWPPAATYNCAQVHHRSPAGTFTRVPGRCLLWSPTPPGPRWPPAYIYINITRNRSFTSIQTVHTHTPCLRQGGARKNEMKMRMNGGWKMRWKWRWDERYLTRTRRGERKRRGKEQTHTNTPSPERANPEKAREKKKAEGRRTRNKTRGGGGRTKAPEPTWHSENLHTPGHATEPTYLGREERMR